MAGAMAKEDPGELLSAIVPVHLVVVEVVCLADMSSRARGWRPTRGYILEGASPRDGRADLQDPLLLRVLSKNKPLDHQTSIIEALTAA